MTTHNPSRDTRRAAPTTLAELLAGAEARRAEPARPDSRAELRARLAELQAAVARKTGPVPTQGRKDTA